MSKSCYVFGKIIFISIAFFALTVLQLSTLPLSKALAEDKPVLYWGSSGYHVQQVQERLAGWGYYKGPIDAVYGAKTSSAVKTFQLYNGLPRDGVVGTATWQALGFNVAKSPKKSSPAAQTRQATPAAARGLSNDGSIHLLAKVIEGEAADEPLEGKVAVGAVILNRMESSAFPKTLSGIIYQPLAFESVSNGQYNRPVSEESIKAASLAMSGWDPTHGSLFFWNPAKRVSAWIWSRPIVTRIGNHVFAH
ncbi:spore cortex-lytic enzyme [Desulfolucanica intricata]|uniref:spore cortex-lytic enzyme n=1 Tax=Desulfolucanica intricata TaxID=1285191 RepID=UPI000836BA64|nr:spore cortex-lytic enzyme [Desulfolucanica intricata]